MPTPLYTTDVQKIVDRTPKTALLATDVFVVADEDGTLSPITKPNAKATLGINTNTTAIDNLAGTGRTTETVKKNADDIATLNSDDSTEGSVAKTVKDAVEPIDATLGTLKETVLSTKLAVNELERQAQIGNGATLDFNDIGIVPLDARATGRANPTVEGLTATNEVTNSGHESGLKGSKIDEFGSVSTYTINTNNPISGIQDGRLVITTPSTNSRPAIKGLFTGAELLVNDYYNVSFDYKVNSGTAIIRVIGTGLGTVTLNKSLTGQGRFNFKVQCLGTSNFGMIYFGNSICDIQIDNMQRINLTSIYGSGNEPSASDCAKIFSYFDGTKSIQLPARIISMSEDESETSTLYIADNEEVRSFGATTDLVKIVNGEFVLEKNVNDDATAVISPPVTTLLLTSGILQAKPNGTVYYEPYYEGSHQTDASSEITLPYEGTIEAVYGYDEDLVEYLLDSSEYSLTGTTLTITDALENEVWFVKMSRSEPLAPEMSVNVLNNEQVTLDTLNSKYYKITFTTANGVPTTVATEVV
jgi:hypothetical protein